MNNLLEKTEQHQTDLTVNTSLHEQCHQGDSIFDISHNQVFKCEPQQWDIKPNLYLEPKQELKPGLVFKSELPAWTLNHSRHNQKYQEDYKTDVFTQQQDYQPDTSMASSNENNGS